MKHELATATIEAGAITARYTDAEWHTEFPSKADPTRTIRCVLTAVRHGGAGCTILYPHAGTAALPHAVAQDSLVTLTRSAR
jgi:hypothetical protein